MMMLLTMVVLTGCCLKHEWEEATCEDPKTCVKCGKTEGEALGHEWEKATCEEPKTCERCGETKGEPLGHEWIEASCEAPKTCKRCKKTEGEALPHEWKSATLDAPKTCINCGATEGDPIKVTQYTLMERTGRNWENVHFYNDSMVCASKEGDEIVAGFYDLDGNEIKTIEVPFIKNYWSWGYTMPRTSEEGNRVGFQVVSFDLNDDGLFEIYDTRGNKLSELNTNYYLDRGYISARTCDDPRYLAEVRSFDEEPVWYLDTKEMKLIDAAEEEHPMYNPTYTEYDESKFAYCEKLVGDAHGYFVESKDETQWGFVDENFNEIAMYKDASYFTGSGFALVTEDGRNYDLINSDFEVVAEGIVQGDGASVQDEDCNVIRVRDGEGTIILVVE